RCQLTIELAGARFPFHDTYNAADREIIGQRPGLHFTLPITPMPDGSDELLTPLSADNRVRWSQISISRYR
ncbi:hypothetical protein, partial [Aeromonas taiwanensis]|uniref:hypothetical protein n=1 Tax=Aeromonas taiwanensis TaxID=633417 RepID=UPI003BA34FB2